jgi:antirestriction protein ArdC
MSVYDIVTKTILEKLEQGIIPWKRPWNGLGSPKNIISKKEYRGINRFLLDIPQYNSNYWLTYKQAKQLGGGIKKGSSYTPIVYWNWLTKKDEKTQEEYKVPLFRYYRGFNIEQTEGLEKVVSQVKEEEETKKLDFHPIQECEKLINSYPNAPPITLEGNRAFYHPAKDAITLPPKENFHSIPEFYSTLFHELTHSTGHISRLDREGIVSPTYFGSYDYSKEELVAEMGSSFLSTLVGIDNNTLDNSTAYIQSWLSKLRNDKTLLVSAAAQAEKAVTYIRKEQGDKILGRTNLKKRNV